MLIVIYLTYTEEKKKRKKSCMPNSFNSKKNIEFKCLTYVDDLIWN